MKAVTERRGNYLVLYRNQSITYARSRVLLWLPSKEASLASCKVRVSFAIQPKRRIGQGLIKLDFILAGLRLLSHPARL